MAGLCDTNSGYTQAHSLRTVKDINTFMFIHTETKRVVWENGIGVKSLTEAGIQ